MAVCACHGHSETSSVRYAAKAKGKGANYVGCLYYVLEF
jgi:hypothetical protein